MDQHLNIAEQVKLFKSVFSGRDDVFAIRWEKESKNGYMPAYHYDPYMFRLHKNKGRQSFLEYHPENFSKIMHDYSDNREGFILWKYSLEERLI